MISLVRGELKDSIYTKEIIDNLNNYESLIVNSEISLNSSSLTLKTLKTLIEFCLKNNLKLNIYYLKFSSLESFINKSFLAEIKNNFDVNDDGRVTYSIIDQLKNMDLFEKLSLALSLVETSKDLIFLNDSFNGGYISIDNFIKRKIL